MEKVRLALILITVAIVVGPPLGILLAYQNNLLGLIVPSEIEQIMNSLDGSPEGDNQTNPIDQINQTGPVDVQYDPATLTATITFQLQNPAPIDVTLNSLSGTVRCDDHVFPLGTASLKSPVQLTVGKPATVTVIVVLTQQGRDHIQTAHEGQATTKVSLVDSTINAGGMTIRLANPISIGEVPLSFH